MIRAREDRWFARFCRTGDPGAVAKVFDWTHPELWRVATYLCRDRHMAEDCVQGAFLTAIESRDQWDPTRPLLPWLLGLLANRVREHRRRAQRAIDPDLLVTNRQISPTERAEHSEFQEAFLQALGRVPEPHRTALERHLVHGKPTHEVAKELGVSAGALRMRLHRGLEHLRQRLPQGLVPASVVALRLPLESVAAMRQRVLEGAAQAAPAAAGSVPWITFALGAIAMNKIVLPTAFVAAALLAAAIVPQLSAPAAPEPAAAAVEAAAEAPPEEPAASKAAVRLAAGEVAAAGDPRAADLPPGIGEVNVILRRAGSGEPVLDAALELRRPGAGSYGAMAYARTDAQGLGRMRSRPGRFVLAAPDFAGVEEVAVEVVAGTTQDVVLEAAPSLAMRLRVLRPDGQPAAGAEIVGWTSLDESQSTQLESPALCVERVFGRCDGNGEFAADLLEATARIRAVAPGLAGSKCVQLTKEKARATLRLGAAAATIAGTVLGLDGRPKPHAHVWIQPKAAGPRGEIRLRADADGRFRCEGAPAGASRVFAIIALDSRRWTQGMGCRFVVAAVDAAAGETTEVALSFAGSARLQVQVTDRQGEPSKDQQVNVIAWDETLPTDLVSRCIARAKTDALGRAEIAGLSPGRHQAHVSFEGQHVHEVLQLEAGEQAFWSASMAPREPLGVELVDEQGQPLAGWLVTVFPAAGGTSRQARTGASGTARFEAIPRGEYEVRIQADDGTPPSARIVLTTNRSERVVIGASQMPTAAIEGRVVTNDGNLAGLVVELGAVTESGSRSFDRVAVVEVDPTTGGFAFEALPAGDYTALVVRKDADRTSPVAMKTSIVVGAGQRVDAGELMALSNGNAPLRIDLVAEDGQPIRSPVVLGRIADLGSQPFRSGPLRMQGQTCVIDDVPPVGVELLAWGENVAPTRLRLLGGAGSPMAMMRLQPAVPVTIELQGKESAARWTLRFALANGDAFEESFAGEGPLRRGFPRGRHQVSAEDGSGRRGVVDLVVAGPGVVTARLELR